MLQNEIAQQILTSTVDDEVLVNDTTELKRQHSVRARRVVLSAVLTSKPGVPVGISLNGGSGNDLVDHGVLQRLGVTDGAGKLDSLTENDVVCVASVSVVLPYGKAKYYAPDG